MNQQNGARIVVHADQRGDPFPRIHEGRYEVDLVTQGLAPPDPRIVDTVRRAGIRLLRVGVGIWLPSKDPDPADLWQREWFTGTTMADVADDSKYEWTHIDKNLAATRDFGCELLLSVDYMPKSLARVGPPIEMAPEIAAAIPSDYIFPDGIRNAPAADPDVFAGATVRLLEHVRDQGVTVRYVELWNEPDLPIFYSGTYDEFWAMYRAFAVAVRGAGHRVGGPSWAGVLAPEVWLDRFVGDCARENVPLDFYSFHRYPRSAATVIERCAAVRAVLDHHGFTSCESIIDEWGWDLNEAEFYGTVASAAFVAGCLARFPSVGVSAQTHILLVDPVPPELGRFHGIAQQNGAPNPIFHTIELFERFQSTPFQLTVDGDDGVAWALAGVDAEGRQARVIVANVDRTIDATVVVELAAATAGSMSLRRLTQQSFDADPHVGWTDAVPHTPGDPLELPAGTIADVTFTLA